MKTSKRKAVKEGKHERIRKLLRDMSAPEPMVREQPWLAEVLEHERLSSLRAGRFPSRVGPSDAASHCNGEPVCDRSSSTAAGQKITGDGVGEV